MRFTSTAIAGVVLIEPDVHRDSRGFFLETYHAEKYREGGVPGPFIQDNHSLSVYGTLRGLHLQVENPQGKLVRAIQGEIWDVAVDVRPGSPSFGQWISANLSADNFRQLYIPPGCAHGFCVLSETAEVEYKCTELYNPKGEVGIAYDDPTLAVAWPVSQPLLSDRDRRNPRLTVALEQLDRLAHTSHRAPQFAGGV
jgi:dTDP-4-dehydrorhamnose 3,5-epimerase